ncbi:2-keto-4-pentenoate hydratase [alpha proteobacterium U9-1i]|nr:2-keto-4-pentenoate hydratase [alpha proteobacterium U9-1i]
MAARFVEARRMARPLPNYPGEMPADLATAYTVQDAAIDQWDDRVAGWKIGLIAAPLRVRFGAERIAGPIFRRQLIVANGEPVDLPVIAGGFAAVEAEFVLRIGKDAPANKFEWTADEAAEFADACYAGVELAGSPFAGINDHGPAVTASDFGNNAGLVLGAPIMDWRDGAWDACAVASFIDGAPVGNGGAASIPGGPVAGLAFMLGNGARRGRPLLRGQLISTGATTGVHPIRAGQAARCDFGPYGTISCRMVEARPHAGVRAAGA